MNPQQALKKYFGYSFFKPNQLEIIESILNGNNILAVLPTGAGKSICYQIPSLVSENFSIIVSPLIALMKDQVDALNKVEEIAGFVNSTMDFKEYETALQKVAFGKLKILFVSPERLENREFVKRIEELSPQYLFVDEAHCISEWGHNFRPSYRKIKDFAEYISVKHISAFTATATPEVRDDIVKQLNFKKPKVFVKGFERENLFINVIKTVKKKETTLSLIKQFETPAIIYTSSRKAAEEIAEYLNMYKVKCKYYHAGLNPEIRIKIQDDFQNGNLKIIAATNAFGMGIDKKDIRLIIHYNTPSSIENFYQEIGRAGRDGKDSYSFLLYEKADMNIHNYFLTNSNPDKQLIQDVYNVICDYGKVPVGSTNEDEIFINFDFIKTCVKRKINRGLLFSTLNTLQSSGYIKILPRYNKQTTIRINFNPKKLKDFIKKSQNFSIKELLLFIVKKYGGNIFNKSINIEIAKIARELNFNFKLINENFEKLNDLGVITFKKNESGDYVNLAVQRVSADQLRIDYKKINSSFLLGQQKIEKMTGFVFTKECRFKYILNYFGEDTTGYTCGKCDICKLGHNLSDASSEYVKEIILCAINENNNILSEIELIKLLKGESKYSQFSKKNFYGSCVNFSKEDLIDTIENLYFDKLLLKPEVSNSKIKITNTGRKAISKVKTELDLIDEEEDKYDESLELYARLKNVRQAIAKKLLQKPALISPDKTLKEIAELKPANENELMKISGFTKRMFNKCGNDLLEEIATFQKQNKKDKTVPPSVKETFKLMREGYSLSAISNIRKLTETVISMHIESILDLNPEFEIDRLISKEFINTINHELNNGFKNIKEIKARLPKEITYPMIRIAAAKFKASSSSPVRADKQ